MLKLLQSIFRQTPEITGGYHEKLITLAIERVIDGTDPRLRALSGYVKKLQPAVVKALDYTIELVDGLPPSIALSPQQFSHDDYIRSFFASPEHINEFLTQSRTLHYYLEKRTGLDRERIHALLVLTRVERNVLGMEMVGDMIKRDVAQVSVSFSKPLLSAVKDAEAKNRFEIKKDVFDYFVELALKDIVSAREKQREAQQQRDLLARKHRTLKSGNWGMESLFAGESEKVVDAAGMEQELMQLESELQQRKATPFTLDNHLESIVNSLEAVRERLWVEPVQIRLNRMGIKSKQEGDNSAVTLQLNEYCNIEGGRIIALPIYIPFDKIPLRPDLLANVDRYL